MTLKTLNSDIMKKRMSYLMICGMMCLLAGCHSKTTYQNVDELVSKVSETTESITATQLMEKLDNGDMFLLLDVREPAEYNAGYIPGAVNIPRGVLEFKIGNEDFWDAHMLYMPEKEEDIIVYCKKGKRSILAAHTLAQLGYTNVKYLEKGWKGWELTYPLIYEKNLELMGHEEKEEEGGC